MKVRYENCSQGLNTIVLIIARKMGGGAGGGESYSWKERKEIVNALETYKQ